VLAVNEITAGFGREPRCIRLVGGVGDATGGPYDLEAISRIAEAPATHYLGWISHFFQIEADGRLFKVIVEGNDVKVIEVP
jgi:hypothetical protein